MTMPVQTSYDTEAAQPHLPAQAGGKPSSCTPCTLCAPDNSPCLSLRFLISKLALTTHHLNQPMAISNLPANYSVQLSPKPLKTNTVNFLISCQGLRGVELPAVSDTAICTLISIIFINIQCM